MWELDATLAADTGTVGDLGLCRVLLMRNRLWPWLILVPRVGGAVEILDLSPADRVRLIEEAALASQVLRDLHDPDKLNLGALGNVVRQLHFHVLGRRIGDPAWPGPVWGSGFHEPYAPGEAEEEAARLRRAFGIEEAGRQARP
jgi:diadenosine tetraphosphate (Ap4A) HIT family hydrolase